MSLPTFLIIGAAKSGTTSLYDYLKQHPEIFMSQLKEPRFFAFDPEDPNHHGAKWVKITKLDDYLALFGDAKDSKAIGEASPSYLVSRCAPLAIKKLIPDVKLIAILRNPIDRAYSGYQMEAKMGLERRPLSQALRPGEKLVERGKYYSLLQPYISAFPAEQLKIVILDDLVSKPGEVLEDLFEFLGVDPTVHVDTSVRHNVGGDANSQIFLAVSNWLSNRDVPTLRRVMPTFLRRCYGSLKQRNMRPVDPLPPEISRKLAEVFSSDVESLSNFLGRDLSSWLN